MDKPTAAHGNTISPSEWWWFVGGGEPGLALAFFFGDEFGSLAAFGVDAVAAVLLAGLFAARPSINPDKWMSCRQAAGQSLEAASSSSSHTVASRPTAPAAGTSTGLAPPIAAATASALVAPETTSQTSRER
jgi:predicted lipid-binding transport protein (Tim44 family)